MRKLALIVAVALLPMLGGCGAQLQQLKNDLSLITSASISPQAVVVSSKSFKAIEGIATDYLDLPRCDGVLKICRSPTVTKKLIPALRKGRAARDNLIAFQRSHPGQLGLQGDFDALNAAINTIIQLVPNAGVAQ